MTLPTEEFTKGVNALVKASTCVPIIWTAANTSFSGEYLFAGINSDVIPFNDYLQETPPSAAKTTFDNAFFAHFGFRPRYSTVRWASCKRSGSVT